MSCVMSYLLCERWAKGSNVYGNVLTVGRIQHMHMQTNTLVCVYTCDLQSVIHRARQISVCEVLCPTLCLHGCLYICPFLFMICA